MPQTTIDKYSNSGSIYGNIDGSEKGKTLYFTTSNNTGTTITISDTQVAYGSGSSIVGTDEFTYESNTLYTPMVRVNGSLEVRDYLNLSTGYTATGLEPVGSTYWDSDAETLSTVLPNGVIGQHFQETFMKIQNDTGAVLRNGKAVSYVGSIGLSGNIRGEYFLNSSASTPLMFLGVVTETIPDGDVGKLTTIGKVRGIQTDGTNYGESWSDGDILYASSDYSGGLTNILPNAPIPAIPIAVVTASHATNGTLMVRPTIPERLTELIDVNGTTPTEGSFPVWDSTHNYFDFTGNVNDYGSDNDITIYNDYTGSTSYGIYFLNSSASTIDFYLPTLPSEAKMYIKNIDNTNLVQIIGSIDDYTNLTLELYDSLTLKSDGDQWFII